MKQLLAIFHRAQEAGGLGSLSSGRVSVRARAGAAGVVRAAGGLAGACELGASKRAPGVLSARQQACLY